MHACMPHEQTATCPLEVCVKVCPRDGLALLLFTLENINTYFKTAGSRRLWLSRDDALKCIQAIQCFTDPWLLFEMSTWFLRKATQR